MAKPKHDYNSEDFYQEIYGYAFNGMNDAEIADALDLEPEVFCRMKAGSYQSWGEKENEEYSKRIGQVLSRARNKINSIVRGAYLKGALGGKKVKSKTNVTRRVKLPDGTLSDIEDVQSSETEQELAPNMQALATWLYHHDKEWRKIERKQDEGSSDVPQDINEGVSIDSWIKENIK